MKCSDVFRHICDNLDSELGTKRCREIRRHLKACPDCRAYLASLKSTVTLYRSLPAPPLSRAAHDRLLRALEARGCFSGHPPRPRRRTTARGRT